MSHAIIRTLLGVCLWQSLAAFAADSFPATQLAPAAELQYSIKARQSGLSIGGSALVRWQQQDGKYSIHSETRAVLVGKILNTSSQGSIDEQGLAPELFTEKRFGKPETQTIFERQNKKIKFSTSAETYPIKGGEQDRSSATWQLIAQARAASTHFTTGSEWKMFVAGRRDAEIWTFKVLGTENIRTALGEYQCLHISKAPPPDSKDQQLDIWLAPGLNWYPVRLRFNDADGDFVDQVLESVTKL